MARVTTHVLDLAAGHPAAGVTVELSFLERQGAAGASESRRLLATAETGADGRPPRPLLEAPSLPRGTYELVFRVGSYFRAGGVALPEPAFLDRVPVREDRPLAPKNYYGASKTAGEVYCAAFRQRGLDVRILRLANVYGPRDTARVIPLWLAGTVAIIGGVGPFAGSAGFVIEDRRRSASTR